MECLCSTYNKVTVSSNLHNKAVVIMARPTIRANDLVADIHKGMDNDELMQKYGLSPTQLASVFTRLVEVKRVTQAELDTRGLLEIEPSHLGTASNSGLEGDKQRRPKGGFKSLNDRQRRIVVGGVILFVLMTLYPPWKQTWSHGSSYSEWSLGYALIVLPPQGEKVSNTFGVRIDFSRLILQWLILTAATGFFVFIWPGPSKSAPPKKPDLHGGRKQ